jgi:hypothetical protein
VANVERPDWLKKARQPARGSSGVWGIDADGDLWLRTALSKFWVSQAQDKDGATYDAGIRCHCGSDSFTLLYAGYSLSAMCTSCGVEDEVYSE